MVNVIVLGPGCPKCLRLEEMCHDAVRKLAIEAEVRKVMDPDEFAKHGVWLTPALIVNGELKVQGKLPVASTLEHWLTQAR